MPQPERTYLTLAEATGRVPVSQMTLRRAIKEGSLPAYKPRGKILIRPDDLEQWIQAARVIANPMPQPDRRPDRLIDEVLEGR